jgi:hypothetical protein
LTQPDPKAEHTMKSSYRVRGNPEIAHNVNLIDFRNGKELLGVPRFCEPLFSNAECGQANEEERVSVPQEGSQVAHVSGSFPELSPVEICLARNAN